MGKTISKQRKSFFNEKTAPYFFIAPTILIFLIFRGYPIVASLIQSMRAPLAKGGGFVGLSHYKAILQDKVFWISLKNTFIYLLIQVPLMVIISIVLSSIINLKSIKGKGFFRMGIFLPSITALVAYSMVVKLLFNADYGLINHLLGFLKIDAINWVSHPFFSKVLIIIAITWRWTGYNTVIIMAGFANISESMYESADIDGASFIQKLIYITIPLLKPVILFVAITSTIGTLQLFDESLILTNGGPNNATITIGHYLYNVGFRYLEFEYAAALSYVLVLIIGVLSFIEMKITGGED